MRKVAVVHYVLAHYREPIFLRMCQQCREIEIAFFSDPVNRYSTVKAIDPAKAMLPIHEGGLRWRFVKNHFCGNWLWQSGVVRLSLSKEFDTIIYEGSAYILSAWIGAILARLTGKRVLMWSHGFLKDEKGIKGWIRKTFYRLAHGMLLYHNRAKEILISKGFKPENLYVVYNSLDYDKQVRIRNEMTPGAIKACRQKLFKEPDLPILLFIGRLILRKRLDMLIEAAKILDSKGLRCNLLFVGEGPEKEKLERLGEQSGLNHRQCFYGACYEEDEIALLISASDLCVSPGEVGLTCMHAFVYGTPVITHDNPALQGPEYEAISAGHNGDFFKKDSAEDMAAVIERWLQKNLDRKNVSRKCHEIIDSYYNPSFQIEVIKSAIKGMVFEGECMDECPRS